MGNEINVMKNDIYPTTFNITSLIISTICTHTNCPSMMTG